MSSNARASRGASENTCVAPLNRYTAVTLNTSVYDVLNTRTSDTNGTPPTPETDAATGSVTVSAARNADASKNAMPIAHARCGDRNLVFEVITKESKVALQIAIPLSSPP
jgi:hypothetical protein